MHKIPTGTCVLVVFSPKFIAHPRAFVAYKRHGDDSRRTCPTRPCLQPRAAHGRGARPPSEPTRCNLPPAKGRRSVEMSLSCVPRAGRRILPLPIHSACRTRLPSSTRYSSPHLPADTLHRCTHGRPCILETCFRLAARLYTRKADPPGRDHRPVRGTPGNGDPPSRRASFLFASTKTQALSWSGQARPDRYALVLVALFPACAAGAAAGRGRPPASAPWSDLLRDWNVRTQCNFSTKGFPRLKRILLEKHFW